MVPINSTQTPVAVDLDIIQNRVAVALAKRERLIKSWTASSSRPHPPPKSQEELDAEDAELFRIEPPHLGLGAPIPKEFLDGDVKRKEISSNEKLKHLILGKKGGLQASKPRDAQEKAGSAKRGLKGESSDEEEGRSGLGRAKKIKPGSNLFARDKSAREEVKREVRQETKHEVKQPVRQEAKPESKQESKPEIKRQTDSWPTQESKIGLTHVAHVNAKKGSLEQKPVGQQAPKKQVAVLKKPLVDYPSSEEEDKAPPDIEIMKPPAKPPTQPTQSLPKPSSISSSKQSSTESASDSEPSDMETIIPQGLTPDVLPSTSVLSPGADDAKREKRRLKKARKRERERQQRKAIATGLPNGGAEKPGVAPASLGGHGLKLKDKLRDANGN
jgi:hypothetical protein